MTGPGYGVLVAFLAYAGVLAWLRPIGRRRRVMVTAFVLADAAVLWWLSGADTVAEVALRDWMPVAQILFTYWLSGAFVGPPMPRAEAWLARWDRRLFEGWRLGTFVARAPRGLLELFELAYLSIYIVIPFGFAIVWFGASTLDAHRYWTVVVAVEVTCYATLPWICTRPPRALGLHDVIDRRRVTVRRFNLLILGRGSIQANTVPSGHAAGAVATALMVGEYLPWPGLALAVLALGIVAGSVIGRYHFAADSILGVAVAIVVWAIAGR